jgi:MFS family permease
MQTDSQSPWYVGITRYQWLVLLLASLGWVFDVFEGQIFVASMNKAMPALAPLETKAIHDLYNNIAFAAFLMGGAIGGVLFGMLSDRIGRKRVMTYTILMYSVFTALSALSQNWWQMVIFRFFVAMGVGGEWAVASTLVAEVFPKRARAWSQSIFHASSVLGTYLAVLAGVLFVAHETLIVGVPGTDLWWQVAGWRVGFALGVVPSLLIIWIRLKLIEPEVWVKSREQAATDSLLPRDAIQAEAPPTDAIQTEAPPLPSGPRLSQAEINRRLALGIALAAVGLATFWGVHIYGKDAFANAYKASLIPPGTEQAQAKQILEENSTRISRFEMLGLFLVTSGGGLGLVLFGWISESIGRRGAFVFYHIGGLATSLILFLGTWWTPWPLAFFLPVFGFLTLGMHAGYAVYFPELFPTRMRGTGGGFCFNGGRLLAAPILVIRGLLPTYAGITREQAAAVLSSLFLVGVFLSLLAPETRGKELPE